MKRESVPLWLKVTTFTLILFYLVLMLAAVANYANATPVSDEWHELMNSGIAIKTARGTLTWDDLTVNYAGHNLIVPRLLTVLNTLLFRYDPRFEILVSIALLWLTFIALASLAHQLFAQRSPHLFWLSLIVLASLTFSARWLVGWSWGLLVSTPYVIFLTVVGVLLAVRMRVGWWLAVTLAVICLLALPASSAGLLTCGVIGVVWWLRGERHPGRLALLVAVAVLGLASILLSERHAANPLTLSPVDLAYFVAVHLGSAQLAPPMPRSEVLPEVFESLSVIIAVLGALLGIVNYRKVLSSTQKSDIYPIFALGLFSVAFSLAVGLDRSKLYPRAILLDHHAPFQNLFWISIGFLSLAAFRSKVSFLVKIANLLFLVLIFTAQAAFILIAVVFVFMPVMSLEDITRIRDCPLASLINSSNCLLYITIEREMIEQNAYGLASHQLGPFRKVTQQPVALSLHFVSLFYDQMPIAVDDEYQTSRPLIVNGQAQYVLFQRTARLLQSLALPDLPDYRFTLRGALTADAACAEQSVKARLIVDDGKTQRVAVEQTVTADLVPFALDLTDWRGRAFSLLYEVDTSEPLTCGHVLWANPRIEFSLASAQTAHR